MNYINKINILKNIDYDQLDFRIFFDSLSIHINNTFESLIKKGNSVLIKPNWVLHHNSFGNLDCTITHPYLLIKIIDFVLEALNYEGK